jgi:hypothetical protein
MVLRSSAWEALFTFNFALGELLTGGAVVAAGLAVELAVFVCRFVLSELHAATRKQKVIAKQTSVKTRIDFRINIGSPFR